MTDTNTPRILVTGAGGAAAVVLLRFLKGATLFAADIEKEAAGLYLVPFEQRVLLPRGDAPEYVETLLDFALANRIDLVIPTVESEIGALDNHREEFASHGVKLAMVPSKVLDCGLDKLLLGRELPGIAVPTYSMAEALDAVTEFPVIVKPRQGSGSRGIRLVESRKELEALADREDLLTQTYLPGTEYSVDVYATQTGVVRAAVVRERQKVDSGIAVASRTLRDSVLEDLGKRAAEMLGLKGVANLQFRRDKDGHPHLIEINPRFPGTMALTIEAGADMPNLLIAELLNGECDESPIDFDEISMVRVWNEHYCKELAVPEHTLTHPKTRCA